MKKIKKFVLVGGDGRQPFAARALEKRGFETRLFGFSQEDSSEGLREALAWADAVVLPLPVSRDAVRINAPFAKTPMTLSGLSELIGRDMTLFAGMMSDSWKSEFYKKGIRVYDYFDREELVIGNAVPTAQGVIAIAAQKLPVTLHSSHCAVTGYGRTAKATARALLGMGAEVTVAARKCSDRAYARSEGCRATDFTGLKKAAGEINLLVNTVPSLVVDKPLLSALSPECLVIEIASAPFGIDFAAAEEIGIDIIRPGSLPGKVAPKTAGEIIADAIINIMEEG